MNDFSQAYKTKILKLKLLFVCIRKSIALLLEIKIFSASFGNGILLDIFSHKIMIQSGFSRIPSYENSIDVWNGGGEGVHEGICEQEFSPTHDNKVFWKWYVVIYVLCYEFIKSHSAMVAPCVPYCKDKHFKHFFVGYILVCAS